MQVEDTDALIVVDVQNDFCTGGTLAVPDGDHVISPINRLVGKFDIVAYSRDWHPEDHCSFSPNPEHRDGSWPRHCVQHTPGAEFQGSLRVPLDSIFVEKATDPAHDSYSAFQDTNLAEALRRKRVDRVFVAGLALDYCVKTTALDAIKNGFAAVVVEDATRAVSPQTSAAAIEELRQAGVQFTRSGSIT